MFFYFFFFIFFSSLQFEPLETFKERASDDIPRIELSTIKIASAGDRRFNVAVFNPHPFSVTKVVHIRVSSPHIRVASQGIVECQIRPAYKHLDVPRGTREHKSSYRRCIGYRKRNLHSKFRGINARLRATHFFAGLQFRTDLWLRMRNSFAS